ncbi:hypothetical protein [Myroides fluvii]|uniref:hypothetical protein n=1 Tax=Myroides fluvii TaxID=2572594 RepID=UPI00131B3075|nr:hypothetical protein [Myroides fluvii]
MDWKELKDFCNSLPESELDKTVIIWGEEYDIANVCVEQLSEDYCYDPGDLDIGCFPVSDTKDFSEEDKENLEVAYSKGTPMIIERYGKENR